MTFDPKNFLTLATQLQKNGGGEEVHRTAIGRAYYAVLLMAREAATIVLDPKSASTHADVIKHWKSRNPQIGNSLDQLKSMRKNADYDLTKQISSSDSLAAIQRATSIFKDLP